MAIAAPVVFIAPLGPGMCEIFRVRYCIATTLSSVYSAREVRSLR